MNAKHQFKYTYNETELEEISPVEVTFEVPGDVTLTQMLYNFQSYLKAVGFVFDGELQIVDDALDNIDTADEVYGCMADWDKDEEESSCCNEGCGCEDYKEQKLKEWNERLAKLEKNLKKERDIREKVSKRAADELKQMEEHWKKISNKKKASILDEALKVSGL